MKKSKGNKRLSGAKYSNESDEKIQENKWNKCIINEIINESITTGQAGSAWKLFHFLHELKLCVHWNISVLLSS